MKKIEYGMKVDSFFHGEGYIVRTLQCEHERLLAIRFYKDNEVRLYKFAECMNGEIWFIEDGMCGKLDDYRGHSSVILYNSKCTYKRIDIEWYESKEEYLHPPKRETHTPKKEQKVESSTVETSHSKANTHTKDKELIDWSKFENWSEHEPGQAIFVSSRY